MFKDNGFPTFFRDVIILVKFYSVSDIVDFVLGRFSHFNIAIAFLNYFLCHLNSKFCVC